MFNFSIDTVSTATSLSTYESYHPCNGKSHECSGSVVVPSRSLLTDLDAKFERDPRSLRDYLEQNQDPTRQQTN